MTNTEIVETDHQRQKRIEKRRLLSIANHEIRENEKHTDSKKEMQAGIKGVNMIDANKEKKLQLAEDRIEQEKRKQESDHIHNQTHADHHKV